MLISASRKATATFIFKEAAQGRISQRLFFDNPKSFVPEPLNQHIKFEHFSEEQQRLVVVELEKCARLFTRPLLITCPAMIMTLVNSPPKSECY
jgi:hypothetical protein